ncbi:MAG: tetratricopeptide repeat protein [Burkholderiaceae bacterium]
MTRDTLTLIDATGLGVALAFGLASLAAWRSARAASDRLLNDQIDAFRGRMDDLRREHAAGRISQAELDAQERGVAEGLLAPGSRPTPAAPRGTARRLALASLALVAGTGALDAWLHRSHRVGEAPRAPAVATAAASMPASAGAAARPAHALSDDQLQRMVDQSLARIRKDPGDAAAWAMLAHSYDMLGRFAESSKAYASLARLVPDDAQVLADYADALGVANGRQLAGEPTSLLRKALAIDPRNVKALALAGTAAFERRDYDEAIARWQQARRLSTDPAFDREIDAGLANARASARGQPVAVAPTASVAPAGAVVAGRLTLADELVAKAPPDAAVFIYATPVGSRMPVAIMRRRVRDLPADFSLDDSMAMVRELRLSQAGTVIVGARVSMRGDVTPAPGDLQGLSAPVTVGTRGLRLEISEVLP